MRLDGMWGVHRELSFDEADRRLYGKLHAASYDLGSALSYGNFLLKKGWRAKPWSRGSIYLQQSAFVTAMVTSYGRAFGQSRGWPKFPDALLNRYDENQLALHRAVLRLRHTVYAHSDAQSYEVIPFHSNRAGDIERIPFFEFEPEQTTMLVTMCELMIYSIQEMESAIKGRYIG